MVRVFFIKHLHLNDMIENTDLSSELGRGTTLNGVITTHKHVSYGLIRHVYTWR